MIVVISPEFTDSRETFVIQSLLERYPLIRFHLRKPKEDTAFLISYLKEIPEQFHSRISIHGHAEIQRVFPDVKVHATAFDRTKSPKDIRYHSTSFHTLDEVTKEGTNYSYYFCSPVFPSISKSNYLPSFRWNIDSLPSELRKKAVALGGIDPSKKSIISELGFSHLAVLGSIWEADDKLAAIEKITTTFADIYEADLV